MNFNIYIETVNIYNSSKFFLQLAAYFEKQLKYFQLVLYTTVKWSKNLGNIENCTEKIFYRVFTVET